MACNCGWALRQGGDLRDALGKDYRKGTHVFDWYKKGQDVALAIAQGLHFLHHSNVIHRRAGRVRCQLPVCCAAQRSVLHLTALLCCHGQWRDLVTSQS